MHIPRHLDDECDESEPIASAAVVRFNEIFELFRAHVDEIGFERWLLLEIVGLFESEQSIVELPHELIVIQGANRKLQISNTM